MSFRFIDIHRFLGFSQQKTAQLLGPLLPPRFGGRVGKMAAALSSLRRHVQRGLPGKTSHRAHDVAMTLHILRDCSQLFPNSLGLLT